MRVIKRKIPSTKGEWIAYGNRWAAARRRRIEVCVIPLNKIESMWNYEYQAKCGDGDFNLCAVLASNSLGKLKQEVKNQKWKLAWLTTRDGCFSHGQRVIGKYLYIPKYK